MNNLQCSIYHRSIKIKRIVVIYVDFTIDYEKRVAIDIQWSTVKQCYREAVYEMVVDYSSSSVVRTIISVTRYGSLLDAGRLSSKYPQPSSPTWRGIRTDAPRLATPAEKSWMLLVSWSPVRRRMLSRPPRGSYAQMCLSCCLLSLSIASSINLSRINSSTLVTHHRRRQPTADLLALTTINCVGVTYT